MNRYVRGALFSVVLLSSGYLGYQYFVTFERLVEEQENSSKLSAVAQQLSLELFELEKSSESERLLLENQIANISQKNTEQKQHIIELSALLLASQQDSERYRSQYLSQRKETSNSKVAMSRKLEKERSSLQQETQRQLAQHLSKLEGEYSEQAQKLASQKRVDELMTNFASLRVDLDVINVCDKQYLERYGEAKSMLSHMRTFIQKSQLSQDYYYFVISNDAQLARKTREICIEN